MQKIFFFLSLFLLSSCIDLYKSPLTNHSISSSHNQVMQKYYPAVARALKPLFLIKGVNFPPKKIVYVDIKDEDILEVWAKDSGNYRYITAFPILRQSGTLGHKLRQGDQQVPEGIYKLSKLKPNSQYHMGIKIDYPNRLDRIFARTDARKNLGGDIYIHGAMQSVGCLSMGNRVAEQLYVLTALTGITNSKIIITPTDFRKNNTTKNSSQPIWQDVLYQHLKRTMTQLPHLNNQRPHPLVAYKRFKLSGVAKKINPLAPKTITKKPKMSAVQTGASTLARPPLKPARPIALYPIR